MSRLVITRNLQKRLDIWVIVVIVLCFCSVFQFYLLALLAEIGIVTNGCLFIKLNLRGLKTNRNPTERVNRVRQSSISTEMITVS